DVLVRDVGGVLDALGRSAEIVAVDDGSTDGSFERLVALREVERRLRVVRLQRNYGQTAALAAGIDHARGDLIVTLDAHPHTHPRDIPRLLAALDDEVDLVNRS